MTRMQPKMRGGRLTLLIAFASFSAFAAQAQTNIRIGVVNMSRLIDQAPQAQVVQQKLKDEFEPRQRDLTQMQADLKKKQETYQRDASVMGEAERANLEREIRDAQRDLQRADNELQEDFNIRRNEEITNLNRSVVEKVQAYARLKGYDLVIYEALFASDAIDITSEVIAAMQSGDTQGSASGNAQGKTQE